MTQHPILFKPDMIQAILEGRKTRTMRPIKPQPEADECIVNKGDIISGYVGFAIAKYSGSLEPGYTHREYTPIESPFGVPGDELYVKEQWRAGEEWYDTKPSEIECTDVMYTADNMSMTSVGMLETDVSFGWGKLRKPQHMPRWASRITLKVLDVQAVRLQDITEMQAFAEGIDEEGDDYAKAEHYQLGGSPIQGGCPAIFAFIGIWDSIYKDKGLGWDTNPRCFACDFEIKEVK